MKLKYVGAPGSYYSGLGPSADIELYDPATIALYLSTDGWVEDSEASESGESAPEHTDVAPVEETPVETIVAPAAPVVEEPEKIEHSVYPTSY